MDKQPGGGSEPPEIERICADELARHGWKLARDPLLLADGRSLEQRVVERVERLCAEQGRSPDETLVRRATDAEYGCLLRVAVERDGSYQQHVALEETMAYGWPEAMRRCHNREMAESAIIMAVNQLWRNIQRCHPDSYFGFFLVILRNEVNGELRKVRRTDEHESVSSDLRREQAGGEGGTESEGEQSGRDADAKAQGALEAAELGADRDRLLELLRGCLKNERRLHVLVGRIFRELNVSEVAMQLNMTAREVSTEMFRAVETIRKCCRDLLVAELRLLLLSR